MRAQEQSKTARRSARRVSDGDRDDATAPRKVFPTAVGEFCSWNADDDALCCDDVDLKAPAAAYYKFYIARQTPSSPAVTSFLSLKRGPHSVIVQSSLDQLFQKNATFMAARLLPEESAR